jgi:hypothetical protein
MAMSTPPMVIAVLALRPTLHPVTDELRKRVQSIRVRSLQDTQGRTNNADTSWRSKQSSSFTNTRNVSNAVNTKWRQSATSLPRIESPMSPMRFSNSSLSLSSAVDQSPKIGIPSTPSTPGIPARYVSRFHNGDKVGDDQILNTIILNKLNVFSIKTYDSVKQFLFQILGTDQKFIREFTWLVFRKAAAEEKFCALFAKLLSEIHKEYPVILEEMRNLHTTYLDIWDITESPDTKVDRRCRLGYSQFLAELTALGILESDTMKLTLTTLKTCILNCLHLTTHQKTVEEYMDCLRQLCGSKVPTDVRIMIRELLVSDLENWISKPADIIPGLSNKSRFACMDLRDLLMKTV